MKMSVINIVVFNKIVCNRVLHDKKFFFNFFIKGIHSLQNAKININMYSRKRNNKRVTVGTKINELIMLRKQCSINP